MNIFKENRKPSSLPDRINWKNVQFKRIIADNEEVRVAYKVIVNGAVVGAIGRVKNSVGGIRDWIWVEKNESFKNYHFDKLNLTRRWAAASLLHTLNRRGIIA